jgi:hypothetical protein
MKKRKIKQKGPKEEESEEDSKIEKDPWASGEF